MMKPLYRLAESLRSGLSRLRSVWQNNEWLRCVVIHLLAHASLNHVVTAGVLLVGVPSLAAELGAVACVALAAYAVEKYADTKFGA